MQFARGIAPDNRRLNLLTGLVGFLSIACFVFGIGQLGIASALLFYVLWGGYLLVRPELLLRAGAWIVPWLFPALAFSSILWSRDPVTTMRLSTELIMTTGFSIIAAEALTATGFMVCLFGAIFVAIAASALFGGNEVIFETKQIAFHGLFNSKNNFGMFCSLLVLSSVSVMFEAGVPRNLRLLSIPALLLGMYFLIGAHSVGALAATMVATMVLLGGFVVGRLPLATRNAVVILLAVMAGLLIVLLTTVTADLGGEALQAVGKDPGLTGRGYLWFRGAQQISERPWLGLGYQAFWRQGYIEAEGLWRALQVNSRTGFTFHNLYYDTGVQLGMVGVATLALSILATVFAAGFALIRRPGGAACLCFALSLFFLSRVYLEVDFNVPFNIGVMLFPILYVKSVHRIRGGPSR